MSIEERIATLERELRWTRIAGTLAVVVLVVLSVGVLTGFLGPTDARFNVVRAKSILLVDSAEKPRIEMVTDRQSSSLFIRDETGHARVYLGLTERMPSLQVNRDDHGQMRLGFDADGKATLHLQSAPFTSYTMSVNDEEGAFYYLGKGNTTHICPQP